MKAGEEKMNEERSKPKFHSVKFKAPGGTGIGATLEIDGKPFTHFREVNIYTSMEEANEVEVKFLADDIEVELKGKVTKDETGRR
jgi:hypothetical protein